MMDNKKGINRAAAMHEIENAMARHCYHHARGTHRDELEDVWHSDSNLHNWSPQPNVMQSYVINHEKNAQTGYVRRLGTHMKEALAAHDYRNLEEISVHTLAAPILEMSEENDFCKAIWYTPGYVSPALPNDIYRFVKCPTWMWERYAVTFRPDADGHYKITDFANMMDLSVPMDSQCWTSKATRLRKDDEKPPMQVDRDFFHAPALAKRPSGFGCSERLDERFCAVKELEAVIGMRTFYVGRRQQAEEVETLWCKNEPDVRFSQENGSFSGLELLKSTYGVDENRKRDAFDERLAQVEPENAGQPDTVRYGTEVLNYQTFSTPCIELAGDGLTAKGLWNVTAALTVAGGDGPVGFWAWGKCGVDFKLEDGTWKIWHMSVSTQYISPAGQPYDPAIAEELAPFGIGIEAQPDGPTVWGKDIPLPEPYEHFQNTFTY